MLRNGSDERGFALIELLVTVVVLGIVLTAVAAATISSTERTLKTDTRVGISAALEEANETLQAERPWVTRAGCRSAKCSGDLPVKKTDGADYYTSYEVTPLPNGSGYRVVVTVLAVRSGGSKTNPADELFPAVTTVFTIESGAKTRVGSLIVRSCAVSQVDERMPAGTCAGTGAKLMDPPEVKAPSDDPDTPEEDESKLYPPHRHYLANPKAFQWFLAACLGQSDCGATPTSYRNSVMVGTWRVPLTATLSGGPTTDPTIEKQTGEVKFSGLKPGSYWLTVGGSGPTSDYRLWKSRSVGALYGSSETLYKVTIAAGATTLVTRMWEPKPRDVTMEVRMFDGTVPWDPYKVPGGADLGQVSKLRAMLEPFPQGRAVIPGTEDPSPSSCPRLADGTAMLRESGTLCVRKWGPIEEGDTQVTFRDVRPGLYSANIFRSYKKDGEYSEDGDKWFLKKRPIAPLDLGLDGSNKWQGLSQNGRLHFLYVPPSGDVQTGGSGTPAVMLPSCEPNRRDLLREFAKNKQGDGPYHWRYHGRHPGTSDISWTPPGYDISPGIKDKLDKMVWPSLGGKGERAAFGWVKYLRPENRKVKTPDGTTWVKGDLYQAAKGGWNDYVGDSADLKRRPEFPYFGSGTEEFFVPDECQSYETGIAAGPDEGA